MNGVSHLINVFMLKNFSRLNFSREVFVLSGHPELLVLGHSRNTKAKQDYSINPLRNKEVLWKQTSVQDPLTFDSSVDHRTPQDEGSMFSATQCRTPDEWSPRLHRFEKLPNSQRIHLSHGAQALPACPSDNSMY
jgi:hypothetical protein